MLLETAEALQVAQTETETDIDRQRQRQTEPQTQAETDTDTDRYRHRQTETGALQVAPTAIAYGRSCPVLPWRMLLRA
eukprot:2937847-Rhodomonas_salina.1